MLKSFRVSGEDKNIDAIQTEIARWEQHLQLLTERQATGEQRLRHLENERERYVLAALAENDSAAQDKMKSLQFEIDNAVQHQRDCVLAITEVQRKLESLNVKRRLAQQQYEQRAIRGLVAESRPIAKRIAEAAEELRKAVSEAVRIRSAIAASIRRLDARERFKSVLRALDTRPVYIWNHIQHSLSAIAPAVSESETGARGSLEAFQQTELANVLRAIEALPIEGASDNSDMRLYKATQCIRGLRGHDLSVDDAILLLPDEADGLLQSGVLKPVA